MTAALAEQTRPTVGESKDDRSKREGRRFLTIDDATVNVFPVTREAPESWEARSCGLSDMMTFALVVREFIPQ